MATLCHTALLLHRRLVQNTAVQIFLTGLIIALTLGVIGCSRQASASELTTETLSYRRIELASIYNPDRVLTASQSIYNFQYLKENQGDLNTITGFIDAARRNVGKAVNETFLVRSEIILVPNAKDMMKLVGNWSENSTAVAISPAGQILVNCDATRKIPAIEVMKTLTHEFAHLYVGLCVRTPLPRWLNEGLVMRIAGNGSIEDNATLSWAVLMKRHIPLYNLESSFPIDAGKQQLAYAEAASVTDYILRTHFSSSIPLFIASLSGEAGIGHINLYYHRDYVDSLEAQWLDSIGGIKAMAGASFSDNVFWYLSIILTLVAWVSVLRRRKRQREIWKQEEVRTRDALMAHIEKSIGRQLVEQKESDESENDTNETSDEEIPSDVGENKLQDSPRSLPPNANE